jgi:hypothetical protein
VFYGALNEVYDAMGALFDTDSLTHPIQMDILGHDIAHKGHPPV